MPNRRKHTNNKKKKGRKKKNSTGGGAKTSIVQVVAEKDRQQYWPGFQLTSKACKESLYGSIEFSHTEAGELITTIKNPAHTQLFINLAQHLRQSEISLFFHKFNAVFLTLFGYIPNSSVPKSRTNEENYTLEVLNEIAILFLFVLNNALIIPAQNPSLDQTHTVMSVLTALRLAGLQLRGKKKSDHLIWYYISRISPSSCDLILKKAILNCNDRAAQLYIYDLIQELIQIKEDDSNGLTQALLPRLLLQLLSIPADKSVLHLRILIDKATRVLDPQHFKNIPYKNKGRFLSLMFMTFFQPIDSMGNTARESDHAYEFILNYYPREEIKQPLKKLIAITLAHTLEYEKGVPQRNTKKGFYLLPLRKNPIYKTVPGYLDVARVQKTIIQLLNTYEGKIISNLDDLARTALTRLRETRWQILGADFSSIRKVPVALDIKRGIQKHYTDSEEKSKNLFSQLLVAETERLQQLAELIQTESQPLEEKPAQATPSFATTAKPSLPPKEKNSAYTLYTQFILNINSKDPSTKTIPDDKSKLTALFTLLKNSLFQQAENELALLFNTLGPSPYLWFYSCIFNKQLRVQKLLENTAFLFNELSEEDKTIQVAENGSITHFSTRDAKILTILQQGKTKKYAEYSGKQAHKFIQTWIDGSKKFNALGYPQLFSQLIQSTRSHILKVFLTSLHYHLVTAPLNLFHCRKSILDNLYPERTQKIASTEKNQECISQVYQDTLPRAHAHSKKINKPTAKRKPKHTEKPTPPLPTGGGGEKKATTWGERFNLNNSNGKAIPQATDVLDEITVLLQPFLDREEAFIFMRSSQVIDESPHSDFDLLALFPNKRTIEQTKETLLNAGFLVQFSSPVNIPGIPTFTSLNGTYKGVPFDFQLALLEGAAEEPLKERIKRSTKTYNQLSTNRTSYLGELGVKKFKRLFIPSKPDADPTPGLCANLLVFKEFIDAQTALVTLLLANPNSPHEFKRLCSNLCLVIKEALRLFAFNRQSHLPCILDRSTLTFMNETEKLVLTTAGKNTFLGALEIEITKRVFETRTTPSSMVYLFLQQLNTAVTTSAKERPLLQTIAGIANTRAIKQLTSKTTAAP